MKQNLVDLIVWAWPVMPRRFKLWAFLNDHNEEGCDHALPEDSAAK